jgi:hypothetical protein
VMEGKLKGEQIRNRGREKAEAMEPWASLREETRARLKTLGFRRFDESEVPRARRVCGDTPSVLEAQGRYEHPRNTGTTEPVAPTAIPSSRNSDAHRATLLCFETRPSLKKPLACAARPPAPKKTRADAARVRTCASSAVMRCTTNLPFWS